MDFEDKFEKFLEKIHLLDVYYCIYRFFKRISHIHKDIKWMFQRLIRGYSDCDLWNLDDYISKMMAKMLKDFKKNNINSHPSEFENIKDWHIALDKMIWAFENYNEDDYCFTYHGEMKCGDPDPLTGNVKLLDSGCTCDKEKLNQHWKKTEEGINLFAKHFYDLWD